MTTEELIIELKAITAGSISKILLEEVINRVEAEFAAENFLKENTHHWLHIAFKGNHPERQFVTAIHTHGERGIKEILHEYGRDIKESFTKAIFAKNRQRF